VPSIKFLILFSSMSKPFTMWPAYAAWTKIGTPTYPKPMTVTFMISTNFLVLQIYRFLT
jgi:hypothetical protein